jgi:hypothetical protein
VVYDPQVISYEQLLQVFWENHDPAQGMRQGNDHGTQYRSAIYPLTPEQTEAAKASLARFQAAMNDAHDTRHITTEIATAKPFYYAETITSSICIKTRTAIAASAASAFACRRSKRAALAASVVNQKRPGPQGSGPEMPSRLTTRAETGTLSLFLPTRGQRRSANLSLPPEHAPCPEHSLRLVPRPCAFTTPGKDMQQSL